MDRREQYYDKREEWIDSWLAWEQEKFDEAVERAKEAFFNAMYNVHDDIAEDSEVFVELLRQWLEETNLKEKLCTR